MNPVQMKLGSIPQRLTYFVAPIARHRTRWDDIEFDLSDVNARAAFISDSTNKKTLETGRNWAEHKARVWNHDTKEYDETSTDVVEFDNDPIKQVRIVGLEIRDKGGRAYKALINETYYVDLREDVVLETMLTNGINVNGVLNGSYIWARVGSEMKLIRVGSVLHDKMIESTKFNEQKAIPESELQVGRIYVNKMGEWYVYFGKMWTNNIKTKRAFSHTRSGYDIEVESVGPREQMLVFGQVWQYKLNKSSNWFDEHGDTEIVSLNVIRRHSFKIASDIVLDIPTDYIESIKNSPRWNKNRYDGKEYNTTTRRRYAASAALTFNASTERDYVHPLLVGIGAGANLGNEYDR